MLDTAIGVCEGLAAAAGVRLLRDERAGDVRVQADADRLTQVFINLISNAVKYNSHDDPWVRIATSVREGRYEVLIEDNGPGIRAEERERLFSKFSRGWARGPAGAQGAGLGLAISWQIMRRLGGTLELLADEGAGARFRVSLEVATPA